MRLWHDQALYKTAWSNATSWHVDCPYWSFHSRHAISLWAALDDTTMQNGALYFLPGTHLSARFDNVLIGPNAGARFDSLKPGDSLCDNDLNQVVFPARSP